MRARLFSPERSTTMGMPKNATEEQIDRAAEYVADRYPNAEHEEYEDRFARALTDIMAIDAAADLADKRAA
jgi:hypothetical protein